MAMTQMTKTEAFADSMDLLNDAKALQARAREDGYLFFRQLLNPDKLNDVRRQILEVCDKHEWLQPGVPLMDGITKKGLLRLESFKDEWMNVYRDVLRIRDFLLSCCSLLFNTCPSAAEGL